MKKRQTLIRIATLWQDTVVSETTFSPKSKISIGDSTKSSVVIPDIEPFGSSYELFSKSNGDQAELSLHPSMEGWIERRGERSTLADLKERSLSLDVGDRGTLKLNDELTLFFQVLEHEAKKTGVPFLAGTESGLLGSFLFAMITHFAVLVWAFANQNFQLAFVEMQIDDRFMEVLTEKIEDEAIDMEEEDEEEEDVGKQAGGEEGKFGEEDKIDKSKVPTTEGEMVDKIKNIGIAKALSSSLMGRGALSSVFGNKDGFADQLNAAMSGGDGELVMGHGAGGMGFRGTGGGGGGTGFGRIHGMGKVDTGGGRGTRARLGRKGKKRKKFKVSRGRPSVGNFCKQADILRVVNSRQRAITYCYEKELARNPELGGKVNMAWRIGLDGKVMKAWVASSSLKNGTVESCMKRSIQRWRFTKPDGGICVINFPFVFNSGL